MLSHHNAPRIFAEGIGNLTELDARELVVHTLRNRTSRLAGILRIERNVDHLALVQNAVDRSADSRRAGREALQQTMLGRRLLHLVDGEDTLTDLELVPLARQLQDGLARDARQDHAVQRAGDQLLLALLVHPEEENVHGAALLDHAVGTDTQQLAVALLLPVVRRQDRRSVVRAQLVGAVTARPRAHVVLVGHQLDGLEARRVVGAGGRADGVDLA